ncbi:PP2C family protein-serine/threonine phosphatase [Blastococcus sp. TF02-09]|uniref:PP2C family protein-serine/threonine phosphatase n=1 Tax=Blastococcus sp. TF02-09 TaxID=2250576 RepID=UPI001F32A422|nr:PP2C family protein-serine/threonine phosphatase [Blastococcus sp. TF02-9]
MTGGEAPRTRRSVLERLVSSWRGAHRRLVRASLVALLLVGVFIALRFIQQPGLAVSMYGLVPVLRGVTWFGLVGGLVTATGATAAFVLDALLSGGTALTGGDLLFATLNRAVVFYGMALLMTHSLRRQRTLTLKLHAQERELSEVASLRRALTPSEIEPRPHLHFAAAFTPADSELAGDFYLVTEGPGGSTTVVVGDVVGHGLEAARQAAFVRATLATFARYTSDPLQLLRLADAALREQSQATERFVTAICMNISAPPRCVITWAAAGHDRPWCLDSGDSLEGGRVGAPLGIGAETLGGEALGMETGQGLLEPGAGVLLFTDGLTEGRAVRSRRSRPLELFGEERARAVVRQHRGAPADQVLDALVGAVADFAGGPLADDLCLIAFRTRPVATPVS